MCAWREPGALHATPIAAGEADALIGCDLIVAAGDECVSKLNPRTRAVISADLTPTADFARNPNWSVDADGLIDRLKRALGDNALVLDAQRLAAQLLGDAIASNMLMSAPPGRKASFQSGGRRSTARSNSTASPSMPTNRPSIRAGARRMIRSASRRSSASTSR